MPLDLHKSNFESLQSILRDLEAELAAGSGRDYLAKAYQYLEKLGEDLKRSEEQSHLAVLYQVSRILGTSLDLDEVLAQVMDAVIRLTGAERGFLVLIEEGEDWKLRAARNFVQETLSHKDMEVSRTIIDTVLERGEGVVTTDAQTDPRFSGTESVVFYALRSIMCAPLLARGQIIGAIYVDNRTQAGLFTRRDLEMLNTLAIQAAIVIENARLYTRTDQALTRRVEELETLAQIDRELNTRLDVEHVLEILHKWAQKESHSAHVWIKLLSDEKTNTPPVAVYPEPLPHVLENERGIEKAIAELAPQTVRVAEGEQIYLIIPIPHSGKPIGVLVFERAQPYHQDEISFLGHLAGRAAAALENARLYQALHFANQAKSQFVSMVSHELRIPMTSIRGYTDLLQQGVVGAVNEQQVKFLEVIRNNVDRMSALVADLSDISRIETGRLKLERKALELPHYIDETLQRLRPKFEEKGQRLALELEEALPEVYADPNRLVQVLTNLMSNACKYTPEGGEIRVVARQVEKAVRVDVVDTGIGIDPKDHGKIFSQFFRSDDPVVRNEQGWGLGLNVTKSLVELMGGEIGFVSAAGEGSIFWFTIPLASEENF